MISFMIVAFDWIIIALGAYFFCLATINALWMGKETRRAELTDGPLGDMAFTAFSLSWPGRLRE